MAFVTKGVLVTVLTEALGTRDASAAAHNNLWAPSQKRSKNACNETERLHQQGPRPPQGRKPPLVKYTERHQPVGRPYCKQQPSAGPGVQGHPGGAWQENPKAAEQENT